MHRSAVNSASKFFRASRCMRHHRTLYPRRENAPAQYLRRRFTRAMQACIDASSSAAKPCATRLATRRTDACDGSDASMHRHTADTRARCCHVRADRFRPLPKTSATFASHKPICASMCTRACAHVASTQSRSAAHRRPIEAALSMHQVSVPRPRPARRSRPDRAARRTRSCHRPATRITSPRPRHRH